MVSEKNRSKRSIKLFAGILSMVILAGVLMLFLSDSNEGHIQNSMPESEGSTSSYLGDMSKEDLVNFWFPHKDPPQASSPPQNPAQEEVVIAVEEEDVQIVPVSGVVVGFSVMPVSTQCVTIDPPVESISYNYEVSTETMTINPAAESVCAKDLVSRLQGGGDYTYVKLKPHGHPSFTGSLGGMQGSYEYRPKNSFYAGAELSWKQGSASGSAGTRSLIYIDAQEKLGYTLALHQDDVLMTFFSGLGYRHFGQKLTPTTGPKVTFQYNELYVPVGLLTNYAAASWVTLGVGVTWMPQVYPTVLISPLRGSRWVLSNTVTNVFVELPVDFTLTKSKRFHLIVDPFYEHWEDGHSTAKTSTGVSLGLPGNEYNFWGVNLNFLYCF